MADWNDLDQAFTLPDYIPAESPWRTLYEHLLDRTRRETSQLQLLTVHILLIERYLTGYVCLRYRESLATGEAEAFVSATVAKDVNTWWLSLAREMNMLLAGAKPPDRAALLKDVKECVADAIQDVQPEIRKLITQRMVANFDRAGL